MCTQIAIACEHLRNVAFTVCSLQRRRLDQRLRVTLHSLLCYPIISLVSPSVPGTQFCPLA